MHSDVFAFHKRTSWSKLPLASISGHNGLNLTCKIDTITLTNHQMFKEASGIELKLR